MIWNSVSATIEISGVTAHRGNDLHTNTEMICEQLLNHVNTRTNIESAHTAKSTKAEIKEEKTHHHADEEQEELDENEENEHDFEFVEKQFEIVRPKDYTSRGFGFLLNTGLVNNRNKCDNAGHQIDSYAQVVVVEHGNQMLLYFCNKP